MLSKIKFYIREIKEVIKLLKKRRDKWILINAFDEKKDVVVNKKLEELDIKVSEVLNKKAH